MRARSGTAVAVAMDPSRAHGDRGGRAHRHTRARGPVARRASRSSTSWTLPPARNSSCSACPTTRSPSVVTLARGPARARRVGPALCPARAGSTCSSRSNGRARGVLALHPLQTFADVAGAIEALSGLCRRGHRADDDEGFLLGEPARREDLGGRPFRLRRRAPPAVPRGRGVRVELPGRGVGRRGRAASRPPACPTPARRCGRCRRQRSTTSQRLGPRDALTGPAVRGDAGTIDRNLAAIVGRGARPGARLRGALPHRDATSPARVCRTTGRRAVEEVLGRWS